MKNMKTHFLFALLMALIAAVPVNAQSSNLLANDLNDWKLNYGPFLFKGEALYEHINGGADLYHEFDFKDLTVAEFVKDEIQMTVEIYAFEQSAFGIYSVTHSRGEKAFSAGVQGVVNKYFAMYWQENYLVSISSFNSAPEIEKYYVDIGNLVSNSLPIGDARPELLNALPAENLVEGSHYHFKGEIALANVFPEISSSVKTFEEAVSARYRFQDKNGEGAILILDESAEFDLSPDVVSVKVVQSSNRICLIIAENDHIKEYLASMLEN